MRDHGCHASNVLAVDVDLQEERNVGGAERKKMQGYKRARIHTLREFNFLGHFRGEEPNN